MEAEVHGAYGTLATYDTSARVGYSTDRLDAGGRLSAGWYRSDGFDLAPEDEATTGDAYDEQAHRQIDVAVDDEDPARELGRVFRRGVWVAGGVASRRLAFGPLPEVSAAGGRSGGAFFSAGLSLHPDVSMETVAMRTRGVTGDVNRARKYR